MGCLIKGHKGALARALPRASRPVLEATRLFEPPTVQPAARRAERHGTLFFTWCPPARVEFDGAAGGAGSGRDQRSPLLRALVSSTITKSKRVCHFRTSAEVVSGWFSSYDAMMLRSKRQSVECQCASKPGCVPGRNA
jgi:hypothetical protein